MSVAGGTDLDGLDFAFNGLPFTAVSDPYQDTNPLNFAFNGTPFIAALSSLTAELDGEGDLVAPSSIILTGSAELDGEGDILGTLSQSAAELDGQGDLAAALLPSSIP